MTGVQPTRHKRGASTGSEEFPLPQLEIAFELSVLSFHHALASGTGFLLLQEDFSPKVAEENYQNRSGRASRHTFQWNQPLVTEVHGRHARAISAFRW